MNPIFLPLENLNNNRSSHSNTIDRYLNEKIDFTGKSIAVSYIHFYDTFHNISSQLDNNKLKYIYNNIEYEVIFPNGTYTYKDIDNYMHFSMKKNGHVTLDKETNSEIYGVNFIVNTVFTCLSVRIQEKYILIVESEGISRFLGINVGRYEADFNSPKIPDITMGFDTMFIHCSVVNNSLIPEFNTVIFTCPINKNLG